MVQYGNTLGAGAIPPAPAAGLQLFANASNQAFSIDPSGNVASLAVLGSMQAADLPTVGTGQTASGLQVNLDANAHYRVDLMAYWTTTASATVTTSWTGPADATMVWGDTTTGGDVVTTLTGVSPPWATGNKLVRIFGFLTTVSAGKLVFTLASSVGASATLKAGSLLCLDRIT